MVMNEFNFSDKDLAKAAAPVWEAMLEAVPDDGSDYTFSAEFEQNMKRLKNKEKNKRLVRTVMNRAAVVILAVLIGAGAWLAVDQEARAAVTRWTVEWYETHIIYRYSGEDLVGPMAHYKIAGLPDSYVETDRIEAEVSGSVFYEDGLGGVVCFDYVYMQQGTATIIVTEDDDVIDVTVDGMSGQLYIPHDPEALLTLTWIDERANIRFTIMAAGDQETLIRMAESVALCTE